MNQPMQIYQSTNQWKNSMLGTTSTATDRVDQLVFKLKEDFKNNVNYFSIIKNLDTTKLYDAWIYDGNKDKKLFGQKEFYSYPYSPVVFDCGDYVSYQYGDSQDDWLITSLDKANYYEVHGQLSRCTTSLKWKDGSGTIHEYPCAVNDFSTRQTLLSSDQLLIPKTYQMVDTQLNDNTVLISTGYRFLFGVPNHYVAYKVITPMCYTKTNLVRISLIQDQIQPNKDDIISGIAYNEDVISNNPTPVATPSSVSITYDSNPNISSGGFKTYTATFYDTDGSVDTSLTPVWSILNNDTLKAKLIVTTSGNTITIKSPDDDSIVGQSFTLHVNDASNTVHTEIIVKVVISV